MTPHVHVWCVFPLRPLHTKSILYFIAVCNLSSINSWYYVYPYHKAIHLAERESEPTASLSMTAAVHQFKKQLFVFLRHI